MSKILDFLKEKSIRFYISSITSILAIIFDIIFIATTSQDRLFSIVTFLMILFGAIIQIGYEVEDSIFHIKFLDFLPIIPTALYAVGFGQNLYLGLETLSDVWNKVNFVGGNPNFAITFIILFAIVLVAQIVSLFFTNEKKNSVIETEVAQN